MAGELDLERLSADWFKRWWSQDFTWAGLSNKEWEGIRVSPQGEVGDVRTAPADWRPATLQDYWRLDVETARLRSDDALFAAGELTEWQGAQWHVVHMPTAAMDGTPSPKAQWTEAAVGIFNELVARRLGAASQIEFNLETGLIGADTRAQLFGAMLAKFPPHPKGDEHAIHVRADYMGVAQDMDARTRVFGAGCVLRDCLFAGKLMLWPRTYFGAQFGIARSIFLDQVMISAVAAGQFTIQGSTFGLGFNFAGDVRGSANFNDCKFGYIASFRANFRGGAEFHRSEFYELTDFSESKFGGVPLFLESKFEAATEFRSAEFSAAPRFQAVKLHEDVTFDSIKFPRYFWTQILASAGFALLVIPTIWLGITAARALHPTFLWVVTALFALGAATFAVFGGALVARLMGIEKLEEEMRAFRKLAKLCDDNRNKRDAARFFKFELTVGRLRFTTHPVERFLSYLYWVTTGCGEGIVRPIISFAAVTAIFASLFWAWEGGGLTGGATAREFWRTHHLVGPANARDPTFIEASTFSARNVFPFASWTGSDAEDTCGFEQRLLHVERPDGSRCPSAVTLNGERALQEHRLAVRIVSTVQSIFSLTLLFLFGLAVRRRFQIS